MDRLERILSRPVAKPYRTAGLDLKDRIYLNKDGGVKRKWYITVVSVFLVVNATFASSSPSGCLPSIAKELHVKANPVAGLVITLFLLGYVFGPLFWAPLSEFFGRRWVFYFTFLGYFAFNFLCAFAPNFTALLIGRFLTGTFASCTLSNAPGVLAGMLPCIVSY
jgi:DHA1 family multidrug resistance protein-like MFS transporter